jgi:hypothetical protein
VLPEEIGDILMTDPFGPIQRRSRVHGMNRRHVGLRPVREEKLDHRVVTPLRSQMQSGDAVRRHRVHVRTLLDQ